MLNVLPEGTQLDSGRALESSDHVHLLLSLLYHSALNLHNEDCLEPHELTSAITLHFLFSINSS